MDAPEADDSPALFLLFFLFRPGIDRQVWRFATVLQPMRQPTWNEGIPMPPLRDIHLDSYFHGQPALAGEICMPTAVYTSLRGVDECRKPLQAKALEMAGILKACSGMGIVEVTMGAYTHLIEVQPDGVLTERTTAQHQALSYLGLNVLPAADARRLS